MESGERRLAKRNDGIMGDGLIIECSTVELTLGWSTVEILMNWSSVELMLS